MGDYEASQQFGIPVLLLGNDFGICSHIERHGVELTFHQCSIKPGFDLVIDLTTGLVIFRRWNGKEVEDLIAGKLVLQSPRGEQMHHRPALFEMQIDHS